MRYALQVKALVQPLSSTADLIFAERVGRPRSPPPHRDVQGVQACAKSAFALVIPLPGACGCHHAPASSTSPTYPQHHTARGPLASAIGMNCPPPAGSTKLLTFLSLIAIIRMGILDVGFPRFKKPNRLHS